MILIVRSVKYYDLNDLYDWSISFTNNYGVIVKNNTINQTYKLDLSTKDKELLDDMFKRKIMHVQDVDVYNKIFVERLIDKGIKKYGWAFRAVYGEEDKYICFRTGEEHYYLLPDEETDYIKDSKYLKRIEKLKKENGAILKKNKNFNIQDYYMIERAKGILENEKRVRILDNRFVWSRKNNDSNRANEKYKKRKRKYCIA